MPGATVNRSAGIRLAMTCAAAALAAASGAAASAAAAHVMASRMPADRFTVAPGMPRAVGGSADGGRTRDTEAACRKCYCRSLSASFKMSAGSQDFPRVLGTPYPRCPCPIPHPPARSAQREASTAMSEEQNAAAPLLRAAAAPAQECLL